MTPKDLTTERAYRIAEREGLWLDSGGQITPDADYLIQQEVDESMKQLKEIDNEN